MRLNIYFIFAGTKSESWLSYAGYYCYYYLLNWAVFFFFISPRNEEQNNIIWWPFKCDIFLCTIIFLFLICKSKERICIAVSVKLHDDHFSNNARSLLLNAVKVLGKYCSQTEIEQNCAKFGVHNSKQKMKV